MGWDQQAASRWTLITLLDTGIRQSINSRAEIGSGWASKVELFAVRAVHTTSPEETSNAIPSSTTVGGFGSSPCRLEYLPAGARPDLSGQFFRDGHRSNRGRDSRRPSDGFRAGQGICPLGGHRTGWQLQD